jgi:intraflagellar transport protein 46
VFGVDVVREAEDVSNTVELELLMQVALANERKMRSRSEVVQSIDDAAHRPKLIDQWVASVAKAQASKPLPQVHYKKPMPTLESLMELWPEEFEQELNAHASAIDKAGALTSLSLGLKEMATLVCVLLDIPVYNGLQLQSLHVLFSLYDEIEKYEQQQRELQQARYS